MACIVDEQDAPTAALVLLNTRLNAHGGLSTLSEEDRYLANEASGWFREKIQRSGPLTRKRSSSVSFCDDDSQSSKTKRIQRPSSPRSSILLAPQTNCQMEKNGLVETKVHHNVIGKATLPSKVSFSGEIPKFIYPAAVTPEELSSESEEEEEEFTDGRIVSVQAS
jgi:hypothetical protein